MRSFFVLVLLGMLVISGGLAETAENKLTIVGTFSGIPSQTELGRRFTRQTNIQTNVVPLSLARAFELLRDGQVDVVMYCPQMQFSLEETITRVFPDPKDRPREYEFGQFVAMVLVHPSNSVRRMSFAQLQRAFSGAVRNWKEFAGPDQKNHPGHGASPEEKFRYFQRSCYGRGRGNYNKYTLVRRHKTTQ